MNRIILARVFAALTLTSHALTPAGGKDDPEIIRIAIANPTVSNMKTIRFLTERKMLAGDRMKFRFIGVYHRSQVYDFSASEKYVKEHPESGFTLTESRGRSFPCRLGQCLRIVKAHYILVLILPIFRVVAGSWTRSGFPVRSPHPG